MPPALAALLGIVAIVGICWALTPAPWQSPDEIAHWAYVEAIATGPRVPHGTERNGYSTDERDAIATEGAAGGAFYPEVWPPAWTHSAYAAYLQDHSRRFADRADGGGAAPSDVYPPLYYALGAIGYLIDPGGTAFARLYAVQLEGVVWLLLTTLGAWLLAGETFGRRRIPQLVTAATAALLPMTSFLSTSVNPDALVITEWTWALWLGARIINRRAQGRDLAAMCAVLGAALVTKENAYALVPPEVLAVAIGVWRRPTGTRARTAGLVLASSLLAVLPLVAWLAASSKIGGVAVDTVGTGGHPVNVRQFLSYLWQFYLPRLWFMHPFRLVGGVPANQLWIIQGTGAFGWLDVYLPGWVYWVSRVMIGLLAISVAAAVSRMRDRRFALFAFYAVALVSLLGLLHVTDYLQALSTGLEFLQGRYLLPAVSLLALSVGLLISRLPRAVRGAGAAFVLIGLLAGQVLSLTAIVHAYYI